MQYGRNTAGRAVNHRTPTIFTRGRANGRDAVWGCGKTTPLEKSSPKTAQQTVRRMRHSPREALAIVIVRRDQMPSTLEQWLNRTSNISLVVCSLWLGVLWCSTTGSPKTAFALRQ